MSITKQSDRPLKSVLENSTSADINEATVFMLYENWKDRADLDAHFEQPYVKQVLQAYEETLAELIEVLSLRKINYHDCDLGEW